MSIKTVMYTSFSRYQIFSTKITFPLSKSDSIQSIPSSEIYKNVKLIVIFYQLPRNLFTNTLSVQHRE